MKKVTFLCTGNSCRSQMAEGFLRSMSKGDFEVSSAGILAAGVHPRAVAVMREIGIDISSQTSDIMDAEELNRQDYVITLCGNAEETCPMTPPGVKRLHWPVKDPVGMTGTEEEIMADFRRARDEIKALVEKFVSDVREGRM